MNKRKINLFPLCVLSAGTLWGSMGLFVNNLNARGLSSLDIVALRGIVAAIIIAVILLINGAGGFKIKLKDIWVFFGSGVCSVLFFNFCYFRAILETSMSVAAVMLYTAPAFVMLISWPLFNERFTRNKVISLFCALLGCVFVSGVFEGGSKLNAAGILAGIGAGFGYALYSIFSRFAIKKGYSSMTITFYTFLFSAIGSFALTDVPVAISLSFSGLGTGVYSILFVIISTVLPYLLYTKGLTGTENGQASIIASIEPVSATVIGFVAFGQIPSVFGFVGMLLVLGGIVISNVPTGNRTRS